MCPICHPPEQRPSHPGPRRAGRDQAAFTLIEILIVVVILGILAAFVMPQFSNASRLARENVLKDDVRYLRTQLSVFKAQHGDISPAYPAANPAGSPTEALFLTQMTQHTDQRCNASASASSDYPYGPYLSKMPENPINGLSTLKIVANDTTLPAPDGTTGWIYKPQTLEIIANVSGTDLDGVHYADY
jgi:general secretion pathway protein G